MPATARPAWLRLAAPLLALALSAAACGGEEAATEESEAPAAATDPTAAAEEPSASDDAASDGLASSTPSEDASEAAAGAPSGEPLTVYSGRSEELVGPALELFTASTGIPVEVRYGDTAEVAAQILEEGGNSPADVFFGQDAGALGALSEAEVLSPLPAELIEPVDERFRSTEDEWVGVSGRARVLAYNPERVPEEELPASVLDLTQPEWAGRVGWAPTNGSFQAFVTAMRVQLGEDAARQWLTDMQANDVQVFENNAAQVEAVSRGEIDLGLVNHYYLYQLRSESPDLQAENLYLTGGDPGALVNVAGVGVLGTTDQPDEAEAMVEWLLGDEAQAYFAEETFEYPLVGEASAPEGAPALEEVQTPDLDLSELADLEGTLTLLQETGAVSGS